MIAIHNSTTGFHPRWIAYCIEKAYVYKLVDCYANDIIDQLKGCSGLMWHHSQQNPRDLIIAKQILFALEHTGFNVFPNFYTAWHFDDKLAQKYLLERIEAPMVRSYVFYHKDRALNWVNKSHYPKVFKLRGGAGSVNVKLIKSKSEASSLVKQAFDSGFTNYDKWGSLKERWRKYKLGKVSLWEPIKGLIRFWKVPPFAKIMGKESGYIYFQDFIPNNSFDVRIIVIGKRAFALKRYVRENDFRASGSGHFAHARDEFDERCVSLAFDVSKKLKAQCLAYDLVFDQENNPLIIEISYGFNSLGYIDCPGYWDEKLIWHNGKFNSLDWMVDSMHFDQK